MEDKVLNGLSKPKRQTKQQLTCAYIRENYLDYARLRYDLIADKLQLREETGWRYMTNRDINTIVCQASEYHDANITNKEVMTALHSDLVPRVHPLREYILTLSPYTPDQPDWIDMVAKQVKVKHREESSAEEREILEQRWRLCFKKWFVGMVASWMSDEVVNQYVLVLIGRQGCYKTTWLERLMPPELKEYCCKLAGVTQMGKDDRLRIAEFGLINIDELDAISPRDVNKIKSIITSQDVNERAAYAYVKERKVRLASFCASSNKREFLSDVTGNRRWWPFEVDSIQNPYYTTLPYQQMYAQAWALIQGEFNHWLEEEENEVMELHNQEYRAQEGEEQLLPILYDIPAEGLGEFLTTSQISERLCSFGGIRQPMALNRLGTVLGKMGYKSVTRRYHGVKMRGWLVYQRDTEEIDSIKRLLKN